MSIVAYTDMISMSVLSSLAPTLPSRTALPRLEVAMVGIASVVCNSDDKASSWITVRHTVASTRSMQQERGPTTDSSSEDSE